jgi:DUF1680 family protein
MTSQTALRKYSAVPFTSVTIEDDFWAPKIEVNRQKTIPIEFEQLKNTGRIDAFRLQWKPGDLPVPHIFWNSDVVKWIEAASYSLATHPDPDLDAELDSVIGLIASAQQPDGYLNTFFTIVEPDKRWTNLRDCHELYSAGHLFEAAVAHFQATGKRTLLEVACRFADYIDGVFGTQEGKLPGYPGHEEIELALVKLYQVTDQERYLHLSQYFIDQRGQEPNFFEIERLRREGVPDPYAVYYSYGGMKWDPSYCQAHKPVRRQNEVTGHAVRAMYLFSGMADVARETGDESLLKACETLWQDLCLRKMYITGGIGPSRHNEGFTMPYDLPNETAYAETCASVGLVLWNHRMLQIDAQSRYADVMERALYNGVLSGVSLDGERFFYENPLASLGKHHRQPWFDCACCPPNLARLLASLGGYIYSYNEAEAAVHLYIQGRGKMNIAGQTVEIQQQTRYPWDGKVTIRLGLGKPAEFALKLRHPGWCRKVKLSINGEQAGDAFVMERGYLKVQRVWNPRDQVSLELDMPVEYITAHPQVRQDVGKAALQRGPVVFCLEQVDHKPPVHQIMLKDKAQLAAQFESELLGGVVSISGEAQAVSQASWKDELYRSQRVETKPCTIRAVPYYAWDNRQPGAMQVWLPVK